MNRKIILTGIIRNGDEYLTVRRSRNESFMPGAWEFPGGKIEENETILSALQRELLEELGVKFDVSNARVVNLYDEIKNKEHYIELDFLIEVSSKEMNIILSEEHDKYTWAKEDSVLFDEYIRNKLKNI